MTETKTEPGLVAQANAIIRNADKQRQIKKITKLYKYVFGWSRKTFFLYVLKSIPDLKPKITIESLKSFNLSVLYATMDKKELSLIIKKLEIIERNNESRKVEDEL